MEDYKLLRGEARLEEVTRCALLVNLTPASLDASSEELSSLRDMLPPL